MLIFLEQQTVLHMLTHSQYREYIDRWRGVRFRDMTRSLIHINHRSKIQAAYCNIHTVPAQKHIHVTGASEVSGATPRVAEASESTCR